MVPIDGSITPNLNRIPQNLIVTLLILQGTIILTLTKVMESHLTIKPIQKRKLINIIPIPMTVKADLQSTQATQVDFIMVRRIAMTLILKALDPVSGIAIRAINHREVKIPEEDNKDILLQPQDPSKDLMPTKQLNLSERKQERPLVLQLVNLQAKSLERKLV